MEVSSDQLGAGVAIAAAAMQLLGYIIYFRLSVSGEIEPNPISWLMFAYGTALLAVLEYASNAGWQELLLPATCAICSIGIALSILLSGRFRLPEPGWEITAFSLDVSLTAAYLWLWHQLQIGAIGQANHDTAIVALLALANATSVTAFIPILRSTYLRPAHEHFMPWLVWSIAYLLLLLASIRHGLASSPPLLLYPIMGVILHAAIALLARHGDGLAGNLEDFEIATTSKKGAGVFAKRAFKKGELVFVMTGQRHRFASRSSRDAFRYPNWIGVQRDEYIDPDPPYLYVNHSCDPNLGIWNENRFVALKNIQKGEELSYDYSITTEEDAWKMMCLCESANCRREVGSIHFLPVPVFEKYLPYINPYFQTIYRSAQNSKMAKPPDRIH